LGCQPGASTLEDSGYRRDHRTCIIQELPSLDVEVDVRVAAQGGGEQALDTSG
jgi:hypothetical protein